MKLFYLSFCLVFYAIINGCDTPASTSHQTKFKIDTAKSIKISGFWATPNQLIDYDSAKVSKDTLFLVTCNEYVYSPFGIIKDKAGFKSSLLKDFDVNNKFEKMDVGSFEFNRLTHKSSRLIFFFDNDPESSKHSSIFKGEIYDSDIVFSNGLKTGINVGDFYKVFFKYFPDELKSKFKVVVLESCVDDIKHTYTFKNKQLNSVVFINDSYWKIDY